MKHDPIKTNGYGDVLYVDFVDGKPHSALTTKSGYDFDWCKRDGEMLFHDSGGGATRKQRHASRMSWREASKMANGLNNGRHDVVIRRIVQRT